MKRIFSILIGCLCCLHLMAKENYPYESVYKDLPFAMNKVTRPTFPDRVVNLKDYGADNTGETLCTAAFAKAIDALSRKGGGTLNVPEGVWFTGPVVLKSNINLHLEQGAVILFSPDLKDYPLVSTSFEGLDTRRCQSPISGNGLENVAITGQGVIDGNGEYWRPLKKGKVPPADWKRITSRGGVFNEKKDTWYPYPEILKGMELSDKNLNVPRRKLSEAEWQELKPFLRPVMVSLVSCKNVWLEGVIFQNSPNWNLHPLMCENLLVENVTVRNPSYAQNGDGIDVESCKNVLVVNSHFDVGDDGICLKSGKDEDGRRRGMPCENVVIQGCTVFRGHGGFVVGSEASGGIRNIMVRDCQFLGTDVGLRFKSKRGRGGVSEHIYARNISMMDIQTDAITFDLYYGGKSAVEELEEGKDKDNASAIPPVDETTPVFRDIQIENIICRGARRALFFNGLPEMPIDRISLKNIHIRARKDAEFHHCTNIHKENVHIVIEE